MSIDIPCFFNSDGDIFINFAETCGVKQEPRAIITQMKPPKMLWNPMNGVWGSIEVFYGHII